MLTVTTVGCVVVLACWSMLTWVSRKMRSEFHGQSKALSAEVQALKQNLPLSAAGAAAQPLAHIPKIEIVAAKPPEPIAAPSATDRDSTAIPPETQALIKAALSAFLGREVRVLSVKLLETPDVATAWATQSRVAVHTSHNQRSNRGSA